MSGGYANPDALVETDWLETQLADPGLVVLDATYHLPHANRDPRAEFADAHIPGARFFDIDGIADTDRDLPHMLPSPERFANAVGALGIGNDSQVVVYDTHGLMSAARAWWMLRVFGHDKVAVLNGGLPRWLAEGRQTESGTALAAVRTLTPRFRPELVAAIEDVHALMGSAPETIVDARDAGRFGGTAPEIWPGRRSGHIPGSRNLPFVDLIDPDDKTVVDADAIRARFAAADVDLDRPITCSCGSGITACVLALGAYLVGQPNAAVYDGSWAEWGRPGDTPVET